MKDSLPSPWHKEPFVWLLIAIPSCAVIMGIATLALSITSYDGLVVDDYYERGMEINRRIEREQRARSLQLSMNSKLSRTRLEIELQSGQQMPLPEILDVQLAHTTRAGFDQELELVRSADGTYSVHIEKLIPGAWYIQVSADDWRIVQRTFLH